MNARDLLLGGVAAVALGAGLIAPAGEAKADVAGTQTTQTATRFDAAQFYVANTRTSCSTSQDTTANLTMTISPPAGQFVYLTGIYFEVAPNATGASSAVVWSSTNLTGSPAWLTNTTASAAANPTSEIIVSEIYPTGLKSTTPGTAVTIVPQTTAASSFACVHAVGYFNAN